MSFEENLVGQYAKIRHVHKQQFDLYKLNLINPISLYNFNTGLAGLKTQDS